jgi:hypothetical protein
MFFYFITIIQLKTQVGAVVYLLAEGGICCANRLRQCRRMICPMESDPGSHDTDAVPLNSSLNLDLDPIYGDSVFIIIVVIIVILYALRMILMCVCLCAF